MAANSTVFLTSVNWKTLCESFDRKNLKRIWLCRVVECERLRKEFSFCYTQSADEQLLAILSVLLTFLTCHIGWLQGISAVITNVAFWWWTMNTCMSA